MMEFMEPSNLGIIFVERSNSEARTQSREFGGIYLRNLITRRTKLVEYSNLIKGSGE